MAKNLKTTRVQMELPQLSLDRLKKLREKTEASSYAEVTKRAYQIYESLVEYAENGVTFSIRDKDGNVRDLEMFI